MKRYLNLSGNSGVSAYEIQDDAIIVKFVDGDTYVYDSRCPGTAHVKNMKDLAKAGRGLATYITRFVRENYAKKI